MMSRDYGIPVSSLIIMMMIRMIMMKIVIFTEEFPPLSS
jgi:hypothetical protein